MILRQYRFKMLSLIGRMKKHLRASVTWIYLIFLFLLASTFLTVLNYHQNRLRRSLNNPNDEKSAELRQLIVDLEKESFSRNLGVDEVCRKNIGGKIPRRNVITDPPSNIIVDLERKLLYCEVPKAACSSWKQFFFQLRGMNVTKGINGKAKKELTHLHQLSTEQRKEALNSFIKFMVTRHPFSRVLSAFRNKIQPNGSYERLNQNWQPYHWRERVGQYIIEQYRGKDVAMEMMKDKSKYDVTFSEFVRFLGEFPDHKAANDLHWTDINSLCYPCDVRYDTIVKFENMAKESLLIFEKAGIENRLPSLTQHATNSSDLSQAVEFYRDIPRDVIRKLYERYYYDFTVFGYDANLFCDDITVNNINYQLITIHG
ncbi:Carbohydrate sulfotransferase 11 [Holothuria leucospilota]|uniref:Carbohydrate sulfotransferase n=1 Tax=Holothuria leucospilota TaxID=206669 RepID=A0A9Q1BF09_HOLLE|nr:Carbohydrate sulfotransferase 11 [Holothuria leucospilota]